MEPKKSENDLQWENLVRNLTRPLQLCDLDFTDLSVEDEKDILTPRGGGGGIPPPPPPLGNVINNQSKISASRSSINLEQFGSAHKGPSLSVPTSDSRRIEMHRLVDSNLNNASVKPPPPLFGAFVNNQSVNRSLNQTPTYSSSNGNNLYSSSIKKNKKTVFIFL